MYKKLEKKAWTSVKEYAREESSFIFTKYKNVPPKTMQKIGSAEVFYGYE